MEYLTAFGYVGLFAASFLAATLLPFSSEVVLGILLLNGFNPIVLVSVATIGNVLGSVTNYAIGYGSSLVYLRKFSSITEQEFNKAKARFQKYGVISLLLAWVPVIGDPLTVAAGVLKIKMPLFLLLVTVGKLARYMIISYMVLS